jgi:dolichol-phosphate mannosyltransferase
MNLAVDSIISQSNKPLKLSIKFGFLLSMISLIYAAWLVLRYFIFSIPVAGWTSVMVSIYFVGGLLFANMGVLGLYIGKTFDETKNRPIYVVDEVTWEA